MMFEPGAPTERQVGPNDSQALAWGRHPVLWGVILALILGGAVLVFWGLLTSVGLYSDGTIFDAEQWQRLEAVRQRLIDAEVAPRAVEALNGALVEPRPGDGAEAAAYIRLALEALRPDVDTNPDAAWADKELRLILDQAAPELERLPTPTPWITVPNPAYAPTSPWALPTPQATPSKPRLDEA